MTIVAHEFKQNFKAFIIWSGVVGGMMFAIMLMFPAFKEQMAAMAESFANMGGFTAAFGMDRLDMTTALGFYGIEGGAMLALGGGMFAALMGASALSGEEGRKTAEFLLTHPLKRSRVALEKLAALVLTVIAFNTVYILLTLAAFATIGGIEDQKAFWLFQIAQFMMQIELGCICLALSAVMRKPGVGIGLGLAALLYFMNIMANISSKAEALKYVTPFAYSDAANVMSSGGGIDMTLAGIGLAVTIVCAVFGVVYYSRKDIHA